MIFKIKNKTGNRITNIHFRSHRTTARFFDLFFAKLPE